VDLAPRALVLAALLSAAPAVALAAPDTSGLIEEHIAAIGSSLDARAAAALDRIEDPGSRLLALRSYLRSRRNLSERWSWTADQIRAFEGSAEQRHLLQEIERVRAAFVAANPGYDIWVNPQVRSLDVQLDHWNQNESVAAAAAALLDALSARLAAQELSHASTEQKRAAMETFLSSYLPSPAPTIAAPGLSPHGQMHAVDFQILRAGQIVAGPTAASIRKDWEDAGWEIRLEDAVRTASPRFVGPLANPREPWHYRFIPDLPVVR
jgi:hypothetical protein